MTANELIERLNSGTLPTVQSTITTSSLLAQQGLDNVDCPICGNLGYIPHKDGPCGIIPETCRCMKKRLSLRRLKNSGLDKLAGKYRFDNYDPDNEQAENVATHAADYLEDKSNKWFFICGRPGSGKTHICTALACELIERGSEVFYMRWREESVSLKQALTDDSEAYKRQLDRWKNAEVLYIDDFLKGSITDADLKLAFTILDYRYLQPDLRTIISTEYSMESLRKTDDAIARRIFERSKGYCLTSPDRNYSFSN